MLKKRIFSAMVAIAIGSPIIIFLGSYALYVFTFLVAAACLHEYLSMIMSGESAKEIRIVGTSLGIVLLVLNSFFKNDFSTISTIMILFYCMYFLVRAGRNKEYMSPSKTEIIGRHFLDMSISLFGILFITTLLGYLPLLRDVSNGLKWVVILMAVVWLGDTGAYFIGNKFGETKLSPHVSPNKSVEGSMAGILFSVVAALLCKLLFFYELDFIDCFNIGVIGGAMGQIGDLFESFIKRSASVKDSGAIMPGHGGIFDRFDGLIFAVPFFYFYARYFF